jgi:integrase
VRPLISKPRSTETEIQGYLGYFKSHIIPDWGDLFLDDVKAVKVEAWLGKLTKLDGKTPLTDGTKAKLRNHLSALFSHCIRWELYDKANPIEQVRQSAKRKKVPETLDLVEIAGTLANIASTAIRVMVAVAAVKCRASSGAISTSRITGSIWSVASSVRTRRA